ncbi:MAG: ABC transporter ATP-binding protein [Bacillota bacterium]|nr:ABC transporter ATP-binding protein [Bacillota bacterium]
MNKKKTSVLKRLTAYGGKKTVFLHLAMLCSALSGILLLMPLIYIHKIVSVMIMTGAVDRDAIIGNAVSAGIYAAAGLVLYLTSLLMSHIFAFEVEQNIVKQSIANLLKKPLGFFVNRESGRIRKTVIDGASETHGFLAHQLPDLASTFISPFVLFVLFMMFDWKLGLVSLLPVIIGLYFMATMMTKEHKVRRDEYFRAMADLSSEAVEYVRGIPVVKTFAQSVESFEKFHSLIKRAHDMVMVMTLGWKNKMSVYESVATSTAFFIVPASIWMIATGGDVRMVVSDSIIYLLVGPMFSMYMMRSLQIQQYMFIAGMSLDKIDEMLDYPELSYGDVKDAENTVSFRNVSFSYGGEKVLEDVTFDVKKGQTVALVGASGGGKTTIARLAARFYDAEEGQVLIGGVDIKSFEQKALMQKLAFVFQNGGLFKMSLRDNIVLGNPDASDAEIRQALADSGALEIVEKLQNGLDTVFGTKGTYFSGGEVQRLCIARAFLKHPGILILDEATAFADPENEQLIQESFKKLAKNHTTLMIAHRLSTIVDADNILVVDAGRIVESGTHHELLAKNGKYTMLWNEYQKSVHWKIGGGHA